MNGLEVLLAIHARARAGRSAGGRPVRRRQFRHDRPVPRRGRPGLHPQAVRRQRSCAPGSPPRSSASGCATASASISTGSRPRSSAPRRCSTISCRARSVARLGRGERTIADRIEPATVLFADIVGFTKIAAELPAVRARGRPRPAGQPLRRARGQRSAWRRSRPWATLTSPSPACPSRAPTTPMPRPSWRLRMTESRARWRPSSTPTTSCASACIPARCWPA